MLRQVYTVPDKPYVGSSGGEMEHLGRNEQHLSTKRPFKVVWGSTATAVGWHLRLRTLLIQGLWRIVGVGFLSEDSGNFDAGRCVMF